MPMRLASRVLLGAALLLPFVGGCAQRRSTPTAAPSYVQTAAPAYVKPAAPTYVQPSSPVHTVAARAPAPSTAWRGGGSGVAFEGQGLPLDQVLTRSRASGKPALLYFTASWCGYCKMMERQTLPDPSVGAHVAGYTNVKYDPDTGEGQVLARRYGLHGFPVLVRIDSNGNKIQAYEGFDPPADFVRRIPSP